MQSCCVGCAVVEGTLGGLRDLQSNDPLLHPPPAAHNIPVLRRQIRQQESEYTLQRKGSFRGDLNEPSGIIPSLHTGAVVCPHSANNRRPHPRTSQPSQSKQLRHASQQNARRHPQRRQANSSQSQQWCGNLPRCDPSLPATGSAFQRHNRRRLNQQTQQLQTSRRISRPMNGFSLPPQSKSSMYGSSTITFLQGGTPWPRLGTPWVSDFCLEDSATSSPIGERCKGSLAVDSAEAVVTRTVLGNWFSLSRQTFLHIDSPCSELDDGIGGRRRSASAAHASAVLQRKESCLKALLYKPHLIGGNQTAVKLKQ